MRRRVVTLSLLVLVATGCEDLIGVPFERAKLAPPACPHALPPEREDDLPDTGSVAVDLIVDTVDWGDGYHGTTHFELGYDVDGLCTGHGDSATCAPPSWIGADVTDGPLGQDNGVGRMLSLQGEILALDPPEIESTELTERLRSGVDAPPLLIRVSDWSGFDELRTTVELLVPHAFAATESGAPRFDGADLWPVVADEAGEPLRFVDDNAYMANRVLVARFDSLRLPFLGSLIEIRDVVLTSDLRLGAGGVYAIERGVLSGWSLGVEVLRVIPVVANTLYGVELCPENVNFDLVKGLICAGVDHGSPQANGVCDAVSLGLAFTAKTVLVGDALPPVPEPACAEQPQPCDVPPR